MNSTGNVCPQLATVCPCLSAGCGWCPSDLSCRDASDSTCGTCLVPPVEGDCIDSRHPLPLVGSILLLLAPCALWFVYTRIWRLRHSKWAFTRSGWAFRCKLAWIIPLPRLTQLLARANSLEAALGLLQVPRAVLGDYKLLGGGFIPGGSAAAARPLLGSTFAPSRAGLEPRQDEAAARSVLESISAEPAGGHPCGVVALAPFETAAAVEAAAKAAINARAAVGQAVAALLTSVAVVLSGFMGDAVSALPMVILSASLGIRFAALLQACLPRSPAMRVSRLNAPANIAALAGCVTALVGSGLLGSSGLCAPLDPLVTLAVIAALPAGLCFSMHTAVERPGPGATVVAALRSLNVSATRASRSGGGEFDGAGGQRLSPVTSPPAVRRESSAGFDFAAAYGAGPHAPEPRGKLSAGERSESENDQNSFTAERPRASLSPGLGRASAGSSEEAAGWRSRVRVADWLSADDMAVLCWSVGVEESPGSLAAMERRGVAHRRAVAAAVRAELETDLQPLLACPARHWPDQAELQHAIDEECARAEEGPDPGGRLSVMASVRLRGPIPAATTSRGSGGASLGTAGSSRPPRSRQAPSGDRVAVAAGPGEALGGLPPTRASRSLSAPKYPAAAAPQVGPFGRGQQLQLGGSGSGGQESAGSAPRSSLGQAAGGAPAAFGACGSARRTPSKALRRYAQGRLKQLRTTLAPGGAVSAMPPPPVLGGQSHVGTSDGASQSGRGSLRAVGVQRKWSGPDTGGVEGGAEGEVRAGEDPAGAVVYPGIEAMLAGEPVVGVQPVPENGTRRVDATVPLREALAVATAARVSLAMPEMHFGGRMSSGLGLTVADMIDGCVPTVLPESREETADRRPIGSETFKQHVDLGAAETTTEPRAQQQESNPGMVTSASMPDLAGMERRGHGH